MPKKNADEQDKIVLRMGEIEQVINNLENTPAWQIVIKDVSESKGQLDDNWQGIWDEEKMLAARVLKFAYKYIVDLPKAYKEELTSLKGLLKKIQNPDKEIIKDYDTE